MSTQEDIADAIELNEDLRVDGRPVSFGRMVMTGKPWEGQNNVYSELFEAPALSTRVNMLADGDQVRVDDRMYLVSGVHDLTGVTRIMDDKLYTVVNIFPLKLSNATILNKVQARV